MNLPAAVLLLPRTLLIALGLVSGLFGAQDSKLPLPSPADQKKAEAEVRSLFKEDFARKDRESRRTLSRKLLALAADEKNTPASRYVVLVLSGDLAVEGFDLPAALSTAEQIEKFYAVDKPPLAGATFTATTFAVKAQVLNNAQRFAQSQDDVVTLGGAYLKLSEDALKERGFDDALSAAQLAERYGKASKAPGIQESASLLTKEISELKKEDDLFAKVILSKAEDPAAKLVKGRYSLFVVGDEKAGFENLAECSDEGLRSVAKLETARPTSPEAMADLAEAWMALSAREENVLQKQRYLRRGRSWFDSALKDAGGITRARIEKRLSELEPKSAPVDLLRLISEKDAVLGEWKVLNGVLVSPMGAQSSRILVPYAPPSEYTLTLQVERKEGTNCLSIGLVVEGRQCRLLLDSYRAGDVSGIEKLDGKGADSNETTRKGKFLPPARPSAIVVAVRKSGITATVDGKKLIEYTGPATRLSTDGAVAVPDAGALWLGCWDTRFLITKMTLTPISGSGRRLK